MIYFLYNVLLNNINQPFAFDNQRLLLDHHSTKEERKQGFKYYCEECDYGIFGKKLFEKHLAIKH